MCHLPDTLIFEMMVGEDEIKIETNDAQEFIKHINNIIVGLVTKFQIKEIRLIRIKNWFDHKWLNYSGKSVGQFQGGAGIIESSLNNEWREKITVPPFNPNRVLSEIFFRVQETYNKMFEKTLHKTKDSNQNIHNRISTYTENGLFVWYSSNTELNQKGSLMIYKVQNDKIETFYASFENKNGWIIKLAKDISVIELTDLMHRL